jgi:Ca2+-transporting ATPase
LLCHKRNASVVGTLNVEEIESSLTFIGFAGMIDPPRNEEKAVSACIQAGIIPVMITGRPRTHSKSHCKAGHNHLRQRRYLEWNKMAALSEKSFQI